MIDKAHLENTISNIEKLKMKFSIGGKENNDFLSDNKDFLSLNKFKREQLSFVNRKDLNISGIESNNFLNSLPINSTVEAENRVYLTNNYRGFGYRKTLEDFENTMMHILNATIVLNNSSETQKTSVIKKLEENLMEHFKNKTLSNDEVIERINKEFELAENEFGFKLTENVAKNTSTLINKFRMSLYNMREGGTTIPYKSELEGMQSNSLMKLTNAISELNKDLPEDYQVTVKDILMNLRGQEFLNLDYKENLIKKSENEHVASILHSIEYSAVNVEKFSKELTEINKIERLSAIGLNYFLGEKNLADYKTIKAADSRFNINDLVDSFKLKDVNEKIIHESNLIKLKKLTKLTTNEKRLNDYVERVHKRLNDGDKLNNTITKEEIKKSVIDCKEMFTEYFSNDVNKAENKNNLYTKLSNNISNKINNATQTKNFEYLETDILETITGTLKDKVYNKIIEDKYEANSESFKAYKIDIDKNLENGVYDFDKNKNEDLLSCDNMQKIFKMISEKTLSGEEALTLLQNNREILKTFSPSERHSVAELVNDISQIKKEEIKKQKENTPYKKYLFEDLKQKDENYNPTSDVADFLKRKQIDSILNTGNHNKATFLHGASNFFANKSALLELYHCASKQVEARKMDTQLSMASQCLDTYRNRVDQDIKETEKNITQIAANPGLAMTGIPALIIILLVFQKARLRAENLNILKNEREITETINHIESVNEQKIKDALGILYKLKNQEGSVVELKNVTDKETLLDVKKDFFYAETLMTGKEKIKYNGKEIALDELTFKHDDATIQLKAIFNTSKTIDGVSLYENVEKEIDSLIKNSKENKQITYDIDESNKLKYVQEKELKKIQDEYKNAVDAFQSAYKKINPIKEDFKNAQDLFSEDNLKDIENPESQQELRKMLKNMISLRNDFRKTKKDLESTKEKIEILKQERENTSPYLDILDENGKIDSEKLSNEIKNNPDKVIVMFNNLNALNFDSKDAVSRGISEDKVEEEKANLKKIKKMIIFNVMDRAAHKNGADLSTSDFFNENISKVIPLNKNLLEELTDYDFSSEMHPNSDKIVFKIKNKPTPSIMEKMTKKLTKFLGENSNEIDYSNVRDLNNHASK